MSAPLFAVASGKGGVGKTFLAIALAQTFARARERTLLLDGDLGLANIDVQLGLQPRGDLLAVVSGQKTMAQSCSPFDGGAGRPGGFDVLAGRSGSGALRGLSAHEVMMLGQSTKLVAAGYARTIVDLGAGLDATVLGLGASCGRVLVVLTDEPTSLTDAYALIKVLAQRPGAPSLAIAVNIASTMEEGRHAYGALARACGRFLGFTPPLAGIVRRDPKVRDAIRAQTPYLTRAPGGVAAEDIAILAAALDSAFAPAGAAPAVKAVR